MGSSLLLLVSIRDLDFSTPRRAGTDALVILAISMPIINALRDPTVTRLVPQLGADNILIDGSA